MKLFFIITVIVLVSILVTFILDKIFKKNRYIKYIPSIIAFIFMKYYFITMYTAPSEGFEALGRFVMGGFLLFISLSSLICSVILDILYKRKNLK